ncbi:MAG TPA: carboxymuconolactone decarboxylase family protein [Verrucomicrobiae bacterium]|nr:carboxymuconolactone decarboxylase family protein [Verrucomicrobiae bacterium]HTZ56011.1 carboxymuconolactone decarboxylase family protein [Candidatus Acidoferrum sp.]
MRLPTLTSDKLSPAQQKAWDTISGPRGHVIGPYLVLMQRPELATAVADLGAALRFTGTLPAADRELAILATGREWGARFEWAVHETIAREAGVDPASIDALRTQSSIVRLDERPRLVIRVAQALCRKHSLDDALYAEARAEFGEPMLVELVTLVGFYCLISCVLRGFAVEPGAGMPSTF